MMNSVVQTRGFNTQLSKLKVLIELKISMLLPYRLSILGGIIEFVESDIELCYELG